MVGEAGGWMEATGGVCSWGGGEAGFRGTEEAAEDAAEEAAEVAAEEAAEDAADDEVSDVVEEACTCGLRSAVPVL